MVAKLIIPVLDIKGGIAVSGKSGNRESYKPLKNVFHHSPNPLKIAEALKKAGASEIYVADLDCIEGEGTNLELVDKINLIIPVMLDCGANDMNSVCKAIIVANKVIVATETLRNIEELYEIFCRVNPERIVLSIDVLNDEILSKQLELDFKLLRKHLEVLRPSEIILLDISRIGTEKGINKTLIDKFASIKPSIIYGGGITPEDLEDLGEIGVDRVLVGTALYSGRMIASF
jgi:phosphoribosylformimino-5-aminoimidazole carboxamide ribotide isomerase